MEQARRFSFQTFFFSKMGDSTTMEQATRFWTKTRNHARDLKFAKLETFALPVYVKFRQNITGTFCAQSLKGFKSLKGVKSLKGC